MLGTEPFPQLPDLIFIYSQRAWYSALATVSMTPTNSFWERICIKCYGECNLKGQTFRSSQQSSSSAILCRQ